MCQRVQICPPYQGVLPLQPAGAGHAAVMDTGGLALVLVLVPLNQRLAGSGDGRVVSTSRRRAVRRSRTLDVANLSSLSR